MMILTITESPLHGGGAPLPSRPSCIGDLAFANCSINQMRGCSRQPDTLDDMRWRRSPSRPSTRLGKESTKRLAASAYRTGTNFVRGRSVVDRPAHNRLVAGSIPAPATNFPSRAVWVYSEIWPIQGCLYNARLGGYFPRVEAIGLSSKSIPAVTLIRGTDYANQKRSAELQAEPEKPAGFNPVGCGQIGMGGSSKRLSLVLNSAGLWGSLKTAPDAARSRKRYTTPETRVKSGKDARPAWPPSSGSQQKQQAMPESVCAPAGVWIASLHLPASNFQPAPPKDQHRQVKTRLRLIAAAAQHRPFLAQGAPAPCRVLQT